MARPELASHREAGLQAPKADLSSLSPWRYEDSPQAPKVVDAVLVCQMPGGTQGDTGQPRQEDSGSRWPEKPLSCRTSPPRWPPEYPCQAQADAPRLDTKARHRREAPPWHPRAA